MATLNIPIDEELKRTLKAMAAKAGKSLQEFVNEMLSAAVKSARS